MHDRRVAFTTLGCKLNQYDSEAMVALFRRAGYRVVDWREPAEVYVVNTCTVTARAAAKSRQLVRQAARRQPDAVIAVAGCYPQTAPDEVAAIPGVDVIVGTDDRGRIVELVERRAAERAAAEGDAPPVAALKRILKVREFEELEIEDFTGHTRAVVKIQEGCNIFCTFCIIPYARGVVRSRRPEAVLSEVRRLAAAGFREIVLTGIHLGSYGIDFAKAAAPGEGAPDLAGVIRAIHEVEGIERIRLSSLEPGHVTPELIELLAEWPKVCPHLHLSLQSGAEETLRRMRRRYTAAQFRDTVERIRRRVPEIGLSTDVMVGFPGETEALFRESLRVVEEIGFSRLHVFPFSARRGTPAAGFPDQVPQRVKEARAAEMIALGERLSERFHRRFLGRVVEVLVEEEVADAPAPLGVAAPAGIAGGLRALPVVAAEAPGPWQQGYTGNYVRVRFAGPAGLRNQIVRVRVETADAEGVSGVLCPPADGAGATPGR